MAIPTKTPRTHSTLPFLLQLQWGLTHKRQLYLVNPVIHTLQSQFILLIQWFKLAGSTSEDKTWYTQVLLLAWIPSLRGGWTWSYT